MIILQGIGTKSTKRTLMLQYQEMSLLYHIKDALSSGNNHYILISPCQVQKFSTQGCHMP